MSYEKERRQAWDGYLMKFVEGWRDTVKDLALDGEKPGDVGSILVDTAGDFADMLLAERDKRFGKDGAGPGMEYNVTINGMPFSFDTDEVTYEFVVQLSGVGGNPKVTWLDTKADLQGMTLPGEILEISDGMVIGV